MSEKPKMSEAVQLFDQEKVSRERRSLDGEIVKPSGLSEIIGVTIKMEPVVVAGPVPASIECMDKSEVERAKACGWLVEMDGVWCWTKDALEESRDEFAYAYAQIKSP